MRSLLTLIALVTILFCDIPTLSAQQVTDANADVSVATPAYPQELGPLVLIDGGHQNLHQVDGGFAPFAGLLRADGYRVKGTDGPITTASLTGARILVIANPIHPSNVGNWVNPCPSAFTAPEIAAIKAWVEQGGRLLLIADHMPFAGAAGDLAAAFGFTYANGFANRANPSWPPDRFSRQQQTLLDHPATQGLRPGEHIDSLAAFTGSAVKAPAGAQVIARFSSEHRLLLPDTAWRFNAQTPREPLDDYALGATLNVGKGMVACFTEAAMFTAQLVNGNTQVGFTAPAAPQNKQFILNLVHYLDEVRRYATPKEALQSLLQRHGEALQKQNQDAYNACYDPDARIYLADKGKNVQGVPAFREFWNTLPGNSVAWIYEVTEVHDLPEHLLAIGNVVVNLPAGKQVKKYIQPMLLICTRKEGQLHLWRLYLQPDYTD